MADVRPATAYRCLSPQSQVRLDWVNWVSFCKPRTVAAGKPEDQFTVTSKPEDLVGRFFSNCVVVWKQSLYFGSHFADLLPTSQRWEQCMLALV